jgi:hypothetical protein
MHTRFTFPSTKTHAGKSSTPSSCIKGIDWFLQELNNGSESYEIVEQEAVRESVLRQRLQKRGLDWIGPHYLGTDTGSATIVKQSRDGLWFQTGGFDIVHLYSDASWSEVERFLSG